MSKSFWIISVFLVIVLSMATYINIVDRRNTPYPTVVASKQKIVLPTSNQKVEQNYLTEEEALRDKPITDIRQAAHIEHSLIRLADDRAFYNVGDSICLTIILKNGFRKNKINGGDKLEVRIFNTNMKVFAAGRVTDYDNGTYMAAVDALWPGKLTISVTLTVRREVIRAVYAAQSEHKAIYSIYGKFDTGKFKEETMCHPLTEGLTKNNYTEICNLTMDNSAMSWYCGKPSNRNILCDDWTHVKSVPTALVLSDIESSLRSVQKKFPNITVSVKGNKQERKFLPQCSSLNKSMTWTPKKVTGYFYNNKWFPRLCNIPDHMNYTKCLKDKQLLLLGDSTIRHWFLKLMDILSCKAITEPWSRAKWHKRTTCVNKRMNFIMEWLPHAQPFHVGWDWEASRYTTNSISSHLDSLDNSSKIIVVLHMFGHVAGFHQSVFRDRMNIISKSVRSLLQRNKHVHVLVKGPHTYRDIWSFFSYVYRDIIFDEFKHIRDNVVYLEMADLTMAKDNKNIHPPWDIVEEAVIQMLGYVCDI